jgi:hypothetical protein
MAGKGYNFGFYSSENPEIRVCDRRDSARVDLSATAYTAMGIEAAFPHLLSRRDACLLVWRCPARSVHNGTFDIRDLVFLHIAKQ